MGFPRCDAHLQLQGIREFAHRLESFPELHLQVALARESPIKGRVGGTLSRVAIPAWPRWSVVREWQSETQSVVQ